MKEYNINKKSEINYIKSKEKKKVNYILILTTALITIATLSIIVIIQDTKRVLQQQIEINELKNQLETQVYLIDSLKQ